LLDRITNFLQSPIALLFSIFTRQIYYNNFLALLYMPKYTKSVRKNNMRKNKRGRSRRGGYWFYPGPGDDEHAFTKLRNKFSSGSWKFWQKQPEEVPVLPVSSDYQPAAEEQPQGSLEYPQPPMESPEPNQPMQMDDQEAPMEPSPPMDTQEATMEPSPPMDNQEEAPMEPETPTAEQDLKGGRRRRQKRTTKKRKRGNMRRRTNKRRRSNKRRR
jgi:hypothetical protein